jgi:hypothetical protein
VHASLSVLSETIASLGVDRVGCARSGDHTHTSHRRQGSREKDGRIVLGRRSRTRSINDPVRVESATGIAPVTSVRHTDVSLQHFAGLVVSLERTPAFRITVGCAVQRPVTHSSHPLESNQNLSVFSRARNRVRQSGSTSAAHVLGRHVHDAHIIIDQFDCQRTHDSRSAGDQQFTEKKKPAETKKAAVVSQGGLAQLTSRRGYRAVPPQARSLPTSRPKNETHSVCGRLDSVAM